MLYFYMNLKIDKVNMFPVDIHFNQKYCVCKMCAIFTSKEGFQ